MSSGVALGLTGLALILRLPMHAGGIAAGAAVWLVYSVWELLSLARRFRETRRLRLRADGSLMRFGAEAEWSRARLLPGSVVTPRLAWIRFETASGTRAAELLSGRCGTSHDWRRFQVIWRHIGAVERS